MEVEVFKELDRDLTDLIFSDQEKCSKAMTVSANLLIDNDVVASRFELQISQPASSSRSNS